MDGVIDATFYIDVALFVGHRISHEDNVYVATFFAQIGNGSNVFITDVTFIEHQEVLV